MLRRQTTRRAARWLFQIGASVTATVIASALFAIMPKPWAAPEASVIERTSGGKFAARVATGALTSEDVAPQAALLPRLAFAPDRTPLATFALDATWNDSPATPSKPVAEERPARIHMPASLRAETHRVAEIVSAPFGRQTVTAGRAAIDAGQTSSDDGLVHTLLGSARSIWSESVSVGGSLMTHLLPQ